MSKNKALAFDLLSDIILIIIIIIERCASFIPDNSYIFISILLIGDADIIFSPEFKDKTSEIIRSLWNSAILNNLDDIHFKARLIPLNKKHPQIPKADEFRPIIVMSPIIKLLEARLLPKLQLYLQMNLQRSQTGFVPGMDIYVNIHRALKQIHARIKKKKPVFCLFLDFKSAYNSVPHKELFTKLTKILSCEEIQLLRAIYSRLSIKIGLEETNCNVGVAQGSMISPALFDIYTEDLISEFLKDGWSLEDVLAYADDHLIICNSIEEVQKAIRIIKSWCSEANIRLNPQKSGILEISPVRKRPTLVVGSLIDDAPVVDSYRYLGLLLDNKFLVKFNSNP